MTFNSPTCHGFPIFQETWQSGKMHDPSTAQQNVPCNRVNTILHLLEFHTTINQSCYIWRLNYNNLLKKRENYRMNCGLFRLTYKGGGFEDEAVQFALIFTDWRHHSKTWRLPMSGLRQRRQICGRSSDIRSATLPADRSPDWNRFSIRFLHTTSTDLRSRHFSKSTWSHIGFNLTITIIIIAIYFHNFWATRGFPLVKKN